VKGKYEKIIIYLTSSSVILAFFSMSGPGPRVPKKKAEITQERVEYNVFLFDEPVKGSKSLKIFKISLTFRFDKLSNLSKSVHTGENSQILTVSNKKGTFFFPNKLIQKRNNLHNIQDAISIKRN
jgi:hypothetical protein